MYVNLNLYNSVYVGLFLCDIRSIVHSLNRSVDKRDILKKKKRQKYLVTRDNKLLIYAEIYSRKIFK